MKGNGPSQGYAYILTHPGTPCVFYDHLFSDGLLRPSLWRRLKSIMGRLPRAGKFCRLWRFTCLNKFQCFAYTKHRWELIQGGYAPAVCHHRRPHRAACPPWHPCRLRGPEPAVHVSGGHFRTGVGKFLNICFVIGGNTSGGRCSICGNGGQQVGAEVWPRKLGPRHCGLGCGPAPVAAGHQRARFCNLGGQIFLAGFRIVHVLLKWISDKECKRERCALWSVRELQHIGWTRICRSPSESVNLLLCKPFADPCSQL